MTYEAERSGTEEAFERAVPNIVRDVLARHGGWCEVAALSEALETTGRFGRERAFAAFVRSARSYGDSLDNYDQRDRVHTGRFVEGWEKDVSEQISIVQGAIEPVGECSSIESRAVTTAFRIRISAHQLLTESILLEAAVAFGQREWMLALVETVGAARRVFEDMERLNVHGNLLSWLADSYEVLTGDGSEHLCR